MFAPRCAGVDHRREIAVESHFKATISQSFGKAARALKSAGTSTSRGSGDHHNTGWPAEYHGKMPRRYAASSRGRRQIAARGEQALGFVERLVERRKPLPIAIRREPGDGLVHGLVHDFERALAAGVTIRHVVLDIAGVFVHVRAFAPQVVADGGAEARVHDPVHGPGVRGTKPRLTLCSPCVPGSKRAMPRSMQNSMPWW